MALEKFKGVALEKAPTVSITSGKWLRFNVSLSVQLDQDQLTYATFYFDRERSEVAVEFGAEKPTWYAVKVHPVVGTKNRIFNVRPSSFFTHYDIQRTLSIPATLTIVNGKQRVVFPVKIGSSKEDDDGK